LGSGRGLSSDKNPIIQICVTHFCVIGIISACHNCSCFPNSYLSVYLSELLRGAVRAVIDYVQSGYRSFTFRQVGDIKRYMNGQPDKEKAAETVYNASLPFLNREECERVKGQLSAISKDMKEDCQQNRNRGFHM
jgi:hypothetical protein